jgi:hypothetical protein
MEKLVWAQLFRFVKISLLDTHWRPIIQILAILAPSLCDFMDNPNTLNPKLRNSFSKYLHLMDIHANWIWTVIAFYFMYFVGD